MAAKEYYTTIRLKGHLVEERLGFSLLTQKEGIHLRGLLKTIAAVREHRRIKVLVLLIQDFTAGWSQLEEIHAELDRLHASGKESIAYLQSGGNKEYYLAAGAQKLFVPPSGTLELVGLRAEILFFKNLLQRFGIQPELYSLGDYKSAAEIFVRDNMSEASRGMLESIFSELQNRLKEKAAAARSVCSDTVQEWIDNGPYTARGALEKRMIDGVLYEDEVESLLREKRPGIRPFPLSKLKVGEGFFRRLLTFSRPQIAYIVAEGIIKTGESRSGRGRRPALGSDSLINQLRDARRRRRVRAVVLRIDSPGGSALASDLIWREVKLTDEKKPVVASFGDVAASGGYYIATAARKILGRPSSLTGSIGVISGKFNLAGLFEQLGISVDSLDFGKRSGYRSASRPFSAEEAEAVQTQMREFYEGLFLTKVAEGRRMSLDSVREVAEGRVWTGLQASNVGLVDQLGGITEALDLARQESGLGPETPVRVIQYARRRRLRDLFSLPMLLGWAGVEPPAGIPDDWV